MAYGWKDLTFWTTPVWYEIQRRMIDEEKLAEKSNLPAFFPVRKNIFRALTLTPLHKTKVVILGQDPYHTPGAADGLAFSCPGAIKPPPTLVNIIKELNTDLKTHKECKGPLDGWAKQGVLMINSVWTVEPHKPTSHALWGWQNLTKEIIETVAEVNNMAVFVFWGKHAQTYEDYTYGEGFHLKSSHPSPMGSHQGFFGSKPFSKINEFLHTCGETPIDWTRTSDYF